MCHAVLAEASSSGVRALCCRHRAVWLPPEALPCEQVPLSRMRSWRARQRWWPPMPSSRQRRASPGPCECPLRLLEHCQACLSVACCHRGTRARSRCCMLQDTACRMTELVTGLAGSSCSP